MNKYTAPFKKIKKCDINNSKELLNIAHQINLD